MAAAVAPGHPHYQHRGPMRLGPFNRLKSHDDPERWICIYPAYINSKKSIKEGRRIPCEKAVDTPVYQEIKMVLDDAKVEYILEPKFYSRERSKEPPFVGRFRIHLKNKEGELIRPEFDSRESLMLYIAEKIPLLKCRTHPKVSNTEAPQPSSGAVPKKKKGKK